MVQWLGLGAFTGKLAWVQSLVGELRSHKPCGTAKKKTTLAGILGSSLLLTDRIDDFIVIVIFQKAGQRPLLQGPMKALQGRAKYIYFYTTHICFTLLFLPH